MLENSGYSSVIMTGTAMICPLKKFLTRCDYQDYKAASASCHSRGASSLGRLLAPRQSEDVETPRASRNLDSHGF